VTQKRVYKEGRSTEGWRRGKKITAVTQFKEGLPIICVSHQFKCENLAVVTNRYPHGRDVPDRIVYAAWAIGKKAKRTGEPEFAIWDHELPAGSDAYFMAEKA
jgi:hypothetical protein